MTTNHELPGSIPGSTVGIFLEGEDSRGDHGLGRLVGFKFKAPPGTTSSSITTHTPSGQRNCASWASQPQKWVTLLPCPGGRTTKSTKRTCSGIGKLKLLWIWVLILFLDFVSWFWLLILIHWCIWLLLLYKYITIHGTKNIKFLHKPVELMLLFKLYTFTYAGLQYPAWNF